MTGLGFVAIQVLAGLIGLCVGIIASKLVDMNRGD